LEEVDTQEDNLEAESQEISPLADLIKPMDEADDETEENDQDFNPCHVSNFDVKFSFIKIIFGHSN
jgi:hypothetical protein